MLNLPQTLFTLIVVMIIGVCGCDKQNQVTKTQDLTKSPPVVEVSTKFEPADAVVIITTASLNQLLVGYGTVIGDGSLVATACHVVFQTSEIGRHKVPMMVTVFSPYLGDWCEARLLAYDMEMDLALRRENGR